MNINKIILEEIKKYLNEQLSDQKEKTKLILKALKDCLKAREYFKKAIKLNNEEAIGHILTNEELQLDNARIELLKKDKRFAKFKLEDFKAALNMVREYLRNKKRF